MSRILVIAEHHDGKLNAATAKTVSAAAAISGASIDVLVLAADPAAVAAEAAKIACAKSAQLASPGAVMWKVPRSSGLLSATILIAT